MFTALYFGAIATICTALFMGACHMAVATLMDASDSTRLWAVTGAFFVWTLAIYDGGE